MMQKAFIGEYETIKHLSTTDHFKRFLARCKRNSNSREEKEQQQRRGNNNDEGSLCEIKVYALSHLKLNSKLRARIEREVCILRHTPNHPNLDDLRDVFFNSTHLFVVTGHHSGGELFDVVEHNILAVETASASAAGSPSPGKKKTTKSNDNDSNNKKGSSGGSGVVERTIGSTVVPLKELQRLFAQLVAAVSHLHRYGVCHRDIKLENVLLDANRNVKLCNFGIAAVTDSNAGTSSSSTLLSLSCGSRHYACPEIVMGRPYSGLAADVWSLGVVLFSMMTGMLPFDDDEESSLVEKVARSSEYLEEHAVFAQLQCLPALKELVKGMLDANGVERLTIGEVEKHPFMAAFQTEHAAPY